MKRIWKNFVVLVMACVMVVSLAACSQTLDAIMMQELDATSYVRGVLKATYLGDFKEYMEFVDVDETEAQEDYLAGLEVEMEYFADYFDISEPSDKTKANIVELYKKIYAKSKFEVKDAVKSDSGYNVEVVISPIDILHKADDDFNAYVDDFNARYQTGEFDSLTDEQYEDEFAKGILEIVEAYIPQIGYEADKSIVVQVKQDSDGLWFISEEDITNMDEWIVAY